MKPTAHHALRRIKAPLEAVADGWELICGDQEAERERSTQAERHDPESHGAGLYQAGIR
jgi:hypothetical protein